MSEKMETPEPYFDIVDVAVPNPYPNLWDRFVSYVTGRPCTITVPQAVWRPGGRERMEQDRRDGDALFAHHVRTAYQITTPHPGD